MDTNKPPVNDIIRPELNLEKWPAIWQPAHPKEKKQVIVLERNVVLPNGDKLRARVEVGSTNRGVLTTEDQKVYYGLQKIWEASGKPSGRVPLSLRQLARHLGRKWGTNVIQSLTDSLMRLRITPIIWVNSYHNSVTGKKIEKTNDPFTVLTELEIYRGENGAVHQAVGYFRFHPLIEANLLNGYTKPLLYAVVVNFKSEIAQMLYSYLDLILANKLQFERKTKELFNDLYLIGSEYQYKSVRARTLNRVLSELQQKPLSAGGVLEVKLDKTKDGKDYKLIATRILSAESSAKLETTNPIAIENPSVVIEKALPSKSNCIEPEDLVSHFLSVFQVGRKKYRPSELAEAKKIILEYQLLNEEAYKFVEFSQREAQRTNYLPKSFNGIVQYLESALEFIRIPVIPQEMTFELGFVQEFTQVERELREVDLLETQGQKLLNQLPGDKLEILLEQELIEIKKSPEQWKVCQRFTPATLKDHLLHLVKKRLYQESLTQIPGS